MLKVGVTGGIGSGKSLVCKIFSALGIPVYDADTRAKSVTLENEGVKNAIIALLGSESYTSEGYNRKFVAELVFSNAEKLRKLNEIIHPAVALDFMNWVKQNEQATYIIKEAAILFESGANNGLDHTVLVYAPDELRIRRVNKRDETNEEQVKLRMKNQWPTDKIRALADTVIVNDDKTLVLPQILTLHNRLISKSNSHG